MLGHERFEELCALAAAGQLSREDEVLINEHLKHCSECLRASQEFSLILRELPVPKGAYRDRAFLQPAEDVGFRQRFLNRARTEGRRFSQDAYEGRSTTRRWFPRLVPSYQFAVAGVAIALVVGALAYRPFQTDHSRTPSERVNSTNMVTTDRKPPPTPHQELASNAVETQSLSEQSQQTIRSLKMQNATLAARLNTLEKQTEAMTADRDDLRRSLARVTNVHSQLTKQMEENNQLLARTTGELEKVRIERTAVTAELAAAKTKINELSEQDRLQTASVDQYRDLVAAGHDITDLMGARNLHIIDVHDADGSGKDRKSFGRVFYTEGKSLIFYAFDLDDKRLANSKYSFEAWGERLGQPTSVKSLGILYADDKVQRRWVLKVDDPRQLAQIDSVFVTVEPHDGASGQPRGKKILYAFLAGQANHP